MLNPRTTVNTVSRPSSISIRLVFKLRTYLNKASVTNQFRCNSFFHNTNNMIQMRIDTFIIGLHMYCISNCSHLFVSTCFWIPRWPDFSSNAFQCASVLVRTKFAVAGTFGNINLSSDSEIHLMSVGESFLYCICKQFFFSFTFRNQNIVSGQRN